MSQGRGYFLGSIETWERTSTLGTTQAPSESPGLSLGIWELATSQGPPQGHPDLTALSRAQSQFLLSFPTMAMFLPSQVPQAAQITRIELLHELDIPFLASTKIRWSAATSAQKVASGDWWES